MIRQQFLDYCQGLKAAVDAIPTDAAEKFLQLLETAYLEGRQVFLMGNGGSGSQCFTCGRRFEQRRFLRPGEAFSRD